MTVKVEIEEEKEEIVEIGGPEHMIDQAHMIDQVHMTGQRVEKDLIVGIEVEIEVVETKVEIKTQENSNNAGTRYSSGLFCDHCKMANHEILNCYKLQKTLKKKGVSLNEVTSKNMSEQEKYQMFREFKTYMDAKDPTN